MSNPNAAHYGKYYWCVILQDEEETEVYAYADYITTDLGILTLWNGKKDQDPAEPQSTLAFAPGIWQAFYAASCLDGSAVSAEHWKGQIAE